jgi:hypothetical protein
LSEQRRGFHYTSLGGREVSEFHKIIL